MKTVITIKADKDVKKHAQELAQELGLPLSTIVNAYLRTFIKNRSVFFSAVPSMTPELERLISQTKEDYKKKKNISPAFSTPQDLIEYLHS